MNKLLPKQIRQLTTLAAIALLVFCNSINTYASHTVGGELTYEWISGNTYKVTMHHYRDCSGITPPSNMILTYEATSCGYGAQTATMNPTGPSAMVTPICQASLGNAFCNGGTLYSVEKTVYEAIITLPGTCNNWQFSVNECCRNSAITNLIDANLYGSYFSATLNNSDVPFNNSVKFGTIPANILINNTTNSLSWNSYDVDGDSLRYEFVSPRDILNNVPVNLLHVPGLTAQQPIFSSLPTTLNPVNGEMMVTPDGLQFAVVAVRVTEFRNGFAVGEVYRDYQFAIMNSTNTLPTLSGINGTSSFTLNSCPGDTIMFDVFGNDADAGQILSLNIATNNTNMGFTSTPAASVTGSFYWIPQPADVSSQPYVFIVDVNDDYCDYHGVQTYAYQIYVNGCNTNDVWPGDANSDGEANAYDLLAIGLAYNDVGPVRPAASYSWIAQPSTNWTNSFVSGINHKHADTDGNGTVNSDDTLAIMMNYGLNHALRNSAPSLLNAVDLTVTANLDTVGMQSLVHFDFDFTTTVDSLHGIAFRMYLDPSLVDLNTTAIDYTNSILGTNGVDMLKIDKVNGNSGFIDVALSRFDLQNISGQGHLARLTIVTTDNVSGKVTLNVNPFDVEAVTAFEFPVTVNTTGDNVVIDPNYLGMNEIPIENSLHIYPVPSNGMLHINSISNQNIDNIKIFNPEGREVLSSQLNKNKSTIDISFLPKGIYYVKAIIGQSTVVRKIVRL